MVYSTPRKARRVPLAVRVHLKLEGVADPVTESLLNLSLGGMAIGLRKAPPMGSLVAFEFDLSDTLIEGTGEVVWARPIEDSLIGRSDVGIRFRYLSGGSRERIFRLVQWFATQHEGLTGADVAEALASGAVPSLPPAHRGALPDKPKAALPPVETTSLPVPGSVTVPMPRPFEDHDPSTGEPLFPRPSVARSVREEPSWPVPELGGGAEATPAEPRWDPFPAPAPDSGPARDEPFDLDLRGQGFGGLAPAASGGGDLSDTGLAAQEEELGSTPEALARPMPFASHLEPSPSHQRSVLPLFLLGLTVGLLGFGLYWFREPLLDLFGMADRRPARASITPAQPQVSGAPAEPAPRREEPPVSAPAPAPAAAPVAEPEAPVASEPEPPPPAEARQEEAPATARAQRVERIQAAAGEGGTVVVILADAPFPRGAVSISRLDAGSPRLLVRLSGIRSQYRPASLAVGTAELDSVRVGLHGSGASSSLHVVLDLAQANVRAEETVDGQSVRIRLVTR